LEDEGTDRIIIIIIIITVTWMSDYRRGLDW
jgi:hypothetical protein